MSTLTEIKSLALHLAESRARVAARPQIDWMNNARIIACFMTLFLHVSAGAVNGISDINGASWWMGNIINSFSRWPLPIFVMISGALLLDNAKDEPISLFYKRRVSRIFIPLVFWTAFYLVYLYFGGFFRYEERLTISSLLGSVLNGTPYYHLWYLYMVVGLYMFLPYFTKVVRQSSPKELLLLCVSLFTFALLGNFFVTYFTASHIPAEFTFIYYVPYLFCGYLISRHDFSPPLWSLWLIFIMSAVINSIGYYFSMAPDHTNNGYFGHCLSITVIPMSISMMFLLKRIKIPLINAVVSSKLAILSLGIYVIHPFFIDSMRFFGFVPESFNPLLSIPLISLIALALSVSSCYLIEKVPGLNKVIGLG